MYVGINIICCIQLGSLKAYKSQYYELMAKIFLFIYVTCSFSVLFFNIFVVKIYENKLKEQVT